MRTADHLHDTVNYLQYRGFQFDAESDDELRRQAARALMELMCESTPRPKSEPVTRPERRAVRPRWRMEEHGRG